MTRRSSLPEGRGRGALSLPRQSGRSGRWSPLPWVERAGGTGPSLPERTARPLARTPTRPFAHSPARSPARPPTRPFARPFAHSPAPPIQSSVRHGPCRRIHRPLPLRSPQTSSPVFFKSHCVLCKELNNMSLLNLFKPARLLIPDVPAPTSRVPFSCVLIGVLIGCEKKKDRSEIFHAPLAPVVPASSPVWPAMSCCVIKPVDGEIRLHLARELARELDDLSGRPFTPRAPAHPPSLPPSVAGSDS